MTDLATLVIPAVGAMLLVGGVVSFWRLARGDVRSALQQRPTAIRAAFATYLLGVAVLVGWWVVAVQPPDFPWQAAVVILGVVTIVVILIRNRRSAP